MDLDIRTVPDLQKTRSNLYTEWNSLEFGRKRSCEQKIKQRQFLHVARRGVSLYFSFLRGRDSTLAEHCCFSKYVYFFSKRSHSPLSSFFSHVPKIVPFLSPIFRPLLKSFFKDYYYFTDSLGVFVIIFFCQRTQDQDPYGRIIFFFKFIKQKILKNIFFQGPLFWDF